MSRNSYTSSVARRLGFRSGFEKDMANHLEGIGVDYEYESENCKFSYFKPVVRGRVIDALSRVIDLQKGERVVQLCSYTVDFRIEINGRVIYLETKGRFTGADRAKHERIKKQNPQADIRIVFQQNGVIDKKTGKRYSDWCEERSIPWFVITKPAKNREGVYLPEEWISNV